MRSPNGEMLRSSSALSETTFERFTKSYTPRGEEKRDDGRGVGGFGGDHDQLRRPGGHADAALADEARFRRRHVRVARPDELVDARQRRRAERRRRDARRAAAAVDLLNAELIADV